MRVFLVLLLFAIVGAVVLLGRGAERAAPTWANTPTGTGANDTASAGRRSFLTEAERLRLFDLERADLRLGKALGPWTEALRTKQAPAARVALAEGFHAELPALAPAIHAARGGAVWGRAEAAVETPTDGAGFDTWLTTEVWPAFERIVAVQFGRNFNSVEILGTAPGAKSTGAWRIAGFAKGGGRLEVSGHFTLQHRGLGAEAVPTRGWIEGLRLEDTVVVAAPRPLFRETTAQSGFDTARIHDNWVPADLARAFYIHPGGVFLGDVNGDEHLDAIVTDRGRTWLYLGDGHGTFRDAGWQPETAWDQPTHAALFDATGDGQIEVLLAGRLFRWDVDRARMTPVPGTTRLPRGEMALCDFDRDGRTDVYVMESGRGAPPRKVRAFFDDERVTGRENRLFRNLGEGQFEEVTESAGASGGRGRTFASAWLFADDDAWPDLFGANEFGRNIFLLNQGDGTFRELPEIDGEFGGYSMGVSTGDLDGDGRTDIYVSNMYSKAGHRVFHHIPLERYPESARKMFLASVKGNKYYRNLGGLRFQDDSVAAGVNVAGWGWSGAIADFDLDGRLDIYAPCGHTSVDRDRPDG